MKHRLGLDSRAASASYIGYDTANGSFEKLSRSRRMIETAHRSAAFPENTTAWYRSVDVHPTRAYVVRLLCVSGDEVLIYWLKPADACVPTSMEWVPMAALRDISTLR